MLVNANLLVPPKKEVRRSALRNQHADAGHPKCQHHMDGDHNRDHQHFDLIKKEDTFAITQLLVIHMTIFKGEFKSFSNRM